MWLNLPGLLPLFLHTASDQKLEVVKFWEWGYSYCLLLMFSIWQDADQSNKSLMWFAAFPSNLKPTLCVVPTLAINCVNSNTIVAVPGRIILLHNSTILPCSKCCSAELLLRAGLICTAKIYEYLIRLCSTHVCMNLALNGSSALQHFGHGSTVEIRNVLMWSKYTME